MRLKTLSVLLFSLLVLSLGGGLFAQLQQSGGPGSSVTANAGSNLNTSLLALESGGNLAIVAGSITSGKQNENVAQINGVTPLMGNGVSGTGSLRVNIASDNTPFTVTTAPKTTCGTTPAGVQLSAVPTSSTLITSAATTCVVAILLNNTTASAVTVTVTDNTATPIVGLQAFSIPANSQLIQPLYGIAFNLGVKWTASGAGVTGGMIGYQ